MDYGPLAADYARQRRPHPRVVDVLEKHVADSGANSVLEVGCGAGAYVSALAWSTTAGGYGLELFAAMPAQWRCPRGVARVQAGAEALPLQAESVDLVFAVDVIHHVVDLEAYFREAYRVLRRDGWLCIVTDSEAIIRSRRPLSTYFPETVAVELARYPALGRLRGLMEAAAFDDTWVAEVGLT